MADGNKACIVNAFLPGAGILEKNPTLLVVAAALIDESGRILLQRRSAGRSMAGLWEFPGGKVEPLEAPEPALVRELEEELGIQVDPRDLEPACFASASIGDRPLLLLVFTCRRWRGEPAPLDADALVWLRPADMVPEQMPPADRPLVDLLDRLI